MVFDGGKCLMVVQVCAQVTPDNIKRETDGLMEASNFFGLNEEFIITRNQTDTISSQGKTMYLIPAFEFFNYS